MVHLQSHAFHPSHYNPSDSCECFYEKSPPGNFRKTKILVKTYRPCTTISSCTRPACLTSTSDVRCHFGFCMKVWTFDVMTCFCSNATTTRATAKFPTTITTVSALMRFGFVTCRSARMRSSCSSSLGNSGASGPYVSMSDRIRFSMSIRPSFFLDFLLDIFNPFCSSHYSTCYICESSCSYFERNRFLSIKKTRLPVKL